MKTKKIFKYTAAILGILLIIALGFALYNHLFPLSWGIHSKVNKTLLSGKAINGYDPVAYFTERKAVEGKDNLTYELE